MILHFQITPERPQITPDHTRSYQNHAFGTNFLDWASPNNFSSLSPSQIWDKFDTKYEYSNSFPSTRIRNFIFQMVDSKSKSHYPVPTLMQNPTEFKSLVFKKQCFWRKKWLTLMCETLPKAQRTRGLSSYHNFTAHSSQILIKLRFQNLNQALTSKSQPNISISNWNFGFL